MTQTDSSDTQLPPTTPTSQPMTQAQASTTSAPPTVHFKEAVPTLTEEEQYEALTDKWIAALQAQMDDVFATFHSSKVNQTITHPESSSNFMTYSTNEIDNRIDYGTASDLETLQDMYDHIDDIYHPVTNDLIKITTTAPSKLAPVEAPPSPPTEDVNFPRFSCYMGTDIHPAVSPAEFSKILLPARSSTT
eukprot:scaffold39141_cov24-Attheya_sp.AAC.1